MSLTFIAKDPNTKGTQCPTVWVDQPRRQGLGKVRLRPIRSDLRRMCRSAMQNRHGFQDHGGLYAP